MSSGSAHSLWERHRFQGDCLPPRNPCGVMANRLPHADFDEKGLRLITTRRGAVAAAPVLRNLGSLLLAGSFILFAAAQSHSPLYSAQSGPSALENAPSRSLHAPCRHPPSYIGGESHMGCHRQSHAPRFTAPFPGAPHQKEIAGGTCGGN